MNISVVFGPDEDLGPDPLDEWKMPRSIGVNLTEHDRVFLAWEETGPDGSTRIHHASQGLTLEELAAAE